MKFLANDNFNKALDQLVDLLNDSAVVCLPSDSCYGLSGVAYDQEALALVQKIKGHKFDKPLSICMSEKQDVLELFQKNPIVDILVEEFLPGRLTIIAETRSGETLGVRLPDHNLMIAVVRSLGKPIFTTSANAHGRPACYSVEELEMQLGADFNLISGVLDLGVLDDESPSTIVKVHDKSLEIVREGDLSELIRHRFLIR